MSDLAKAAAASQQLPEDPFAYKDSGRPGSCGRCTTSTSSRVRCSRPNTLHARCVQAEGADVVGRGFELQSLDDNDPPQTRARRSRAGPRSSSRSKRTSAATRASASGSRWPTRTSSRSAGRARVQPRRADRAARRHVARARAHGPGPHRRPPVRPEARRQDRLVQALRPRDVDASDGGWSTPRRRRRLRGNELIVLRNYTPRSDYYGLPDHIPALAAIAGWRAQAEFNVRFFDNQAVPSVRGRRRGRRHHARARGAIKDHFRRSRATRTGRSSSRSRRPPGDEASGRSSGSRSSASTSRTRASGCTSRTTPSRSASPTGCRRTGSAGRSSARSADRPPSR
jgi:hypothetical protein